MGGDQFVGISTGIDTVTRPFILIWRRYHLCRDGVEFYVTVASHQISLGINDSGLMSTLPQGTCSLVFTIHSKGIATTDNFHSNRYTVFVFGCQNQVDMVSH